MRDLIAAVDAVRSNKTFFTHKIAQAVFDRQIKRMSDHAKNRPRWCERSTREHSHNFHKQTRQQTPTLGVFFI